MKLVTKGNSIVCKKTGLIIEDTSFIELEFKRDNFDIYEITDWSFDDRDVEVSFKEIFSIGDRVLLANTGIVTPFDNKTTYSIVKPEQIICKIDESNWSVPVNNPNNDILVIESYVSLSNINLTILFKENKSSYLTDGDDISVFEDILIIDKKYNDIVTEDKFSSAKLVVDKKTSTISIINEIDQELTILNPDNIRVHYDYKKVGR